MSANLATSTNTVDFNCSQSIGSQPSIFTDIYQSQYNISIWQRRLPTEMADAINDMLQSKKTLALVQRVTPDNTAAYIRGKLTGFACADALSEDVALMVDMFCCLFDEAEVGLRLKTLDSAMCPKFHVDQIPCRLVTTYTGVATQWLENDDINRSKLGRDSIEVAGDLSSVFSSDRAIKQMHAGDVALLKGSGWEGNESMGLVHRSPELMLNERRLILTLDLL